MKLKHLLQWMLFALLAFTFNACDNEPLEGTFITDDGGGTQVEDGQFIATINGEVFTATSVSATLTDGVLVVTGFADNGDAISFAISEAGPCTYDLSILPNLAQFIPSGQTGNPYISTSSAGGSGSLGISVFDSDALTVSGVFSFIGAREGVDGNGDPITETVEISVGGFSEIVFELVSGSAVGSDCSGTGGGGGGVDPVAAFFALVNGEEFVDVTFTSESFTVTGIPMVKLLATTSNGATMRIDIPEGLGTGTFEFMDPISDGTKLIATYTDPIGEIYTSDVGSGSITITEFGTVTGKLAATFSFIGTDPVDPGDTTTVNVTEGSFNTDYIDNSGGIENSFSAEVDGLAYAPTSITVSQAPFQGVTLLSITTIDELTNQSVTLSFPIDIEAGSYEMSPLFTDGSEKVGIYNPDIGNSILFKSDPGVLTITSYELNSGIIEGTFTFTAIDPTGNDSTEYAISNGQFTVQIQ